MDQNWALEVVEQEERAVPFCECGARTVPVARGGALWLQCSSLSQPQSFLGRLLRVDFPVWHTRRLIIDAAALSPEDP